VQECAKSASDYCLFEVDGTDLVCYSLVWSLAHLAHFFTKLIVRLITKFTLLLNRHFRWARSSTSNFRRVDIYKFSWCSSTFSGLKGYQNRKPYLK